jgi:hypothetical protein
LSKESYQLSTRVIISELVLNGKRPTRLIRKGRRRRRRRRNAVREMERSMREKKDTQREMTERNGICDTGLSTQNYDMILRVHLFRVETKKDGRPTHKSGLN